MGKMRGLGLMAAMAAMFTPVGMFAPTPMDIRSKRKDTPRLTEEEREQKKGLKKFEYEKGSVWALNQRNADRKANKLNLK